MLIIFQKFQRNKGNTNPGTKLSDFTDFEFIGRGHFGKVYKVRSNIDNKIYSLKCINKSAIQEEQEFLNLAAEREVLSTIEHPYIVKMYSSFQTKEKLCFVMEYLNGGELFYQLRKSGKFDEETTSFYAAQIVLAVEHLHKNNIMYRDLKPENILLDQDGNAVLTDFGLAKLGMSRDKTTKTVCGTPEYIAPEIIQNKPYDKSADWWSLGILIYEMLSGKHPYKNKNNDQAAMYRKIVEVPVKMRPEFSSEAKSLINGLLAIKSHNRLGYSDLGAEEIKHHDFFKINWSMLEEKQFSPLKIPSEENDDGAMLDNDMKEKQGIEGMEFQNNFKRENPIEELLAEMDEDELAQNAGYDLDKIKEFKRVSLRKHKAQREEFRYFENFDFTRVSTTKKKKS